MTEFKAVMFRLCAVPVNQIKRTGFNTSIVQKKFGAEDWTWLRLQ